MSNKDYKRPEIPKKAKPYALLAIFLFIISVFMTFFAFLLKSKQIFMFALLSWGLFTLIKLLYNRRVPLPLRKEITEKILPSLPLDSMVEESVSIPVSKQSKHDIVFSIVLIGIGIIFLICFLCFGNLTGNYQIYGVALFLALFTLALLLVAKNHFHVMALEKGINPFAIKITRNGISFPSSIVRFFDVKSIEDFKTFRLKELYLPWRDIEQWTVDSGYSDDPPYYLLKLNNGKEYKIDRSRISNESKLLDFVRQFGQKQIILKDDIEER